MTVWAIFFLGQSPGQIKICMGTIPVPNCTCVTSFNVEHPRAKRVVTQSTHQLT